MPTQEILPGKIVVNTQSYYDNRMPVWGIILPKKGFLDFFTKEKGPWPTGKIINNKLHDKFGAYMPFEVNGKPNPFSYSLDDKRKILPSKHFLEDDGFFGVRYFGDIYSPGLERKLGFEVMRQTGHVIPFNLKDLDIIEKARSYAFEEGGIHPHHVCDVGADMTFVIRYFSGQYKNKSLDEVNYEFGSSARNWAEILRHCNFPEENIFS